MSKSKADADQPQVIEPLPAPTVVPLSAPIGPARVFRDKVYTSRTLVMQDGQVIPVVKGLVTACGDDQFKFLSDHPDLEPVTE